MDDAAGQVNDGIEEGQVLFFVPFFTRIVSTLTGIGALALLRVQCAFGLERVAAFFSLVDIRAVSSARWQGVAQEDLVGHVIIVNKRFAAAAAIVAVFANRLSLILVEL